MNRKSFAVLVLALVALLAVMPLMTSAQDEEGVVTVPAGETVKIGLATDLSNIIPAPGQDIANGGELAVIQWNEREDAPFEVELVVEDDLCTGEGATSVANLFASEPTIVAVVGHVCSGASIPASEIYEDARIPMVSPSSTADQFTARGLDVTNRTAFNDSIQGVVAARFITEVIGAETIAVLHDNSSYGLGLAETVRATFEELGGEVVAFEVVDPEEQDYRSVLTVLAESEPDLVYLGGYQNQAALLVQQMDEVGLDADFFSADGVYTQDFLDLAGDSAEGAYVSFGSQQGSEELNEAFDAAYEEEFGVAPDELGPFHAQSYDAANIILAALESVAVVNEDGSVTVDREALIAAIRATSDYQGVSGVVSCDDRGDCGTAVISVFVAEDGEWVEVEVPEELQVTGEAMAE